MERAEKIPRITFVADAVAQPIIQRLFTVIEDLNVAIVDAEKTGIKWDLEIVDSPTHPIAVQTVYARSADNGMVNSRVRQMCALPDTQMAFTSVLEMFGKAVA